MAFHCLISNDDGILAPGIKVLEDHLSQACKVTVVAPLEERSTTGHSITLDKPLRIEKLGERRFGCSGFPGDCTLIGLGQICKNDRPDVVVTGINRGANLGQDLYYSGTIAAAREAAFHKVPSIATSLVLRSVDSYQHYDTAGVIALRMVQEGLWKLLPEMALLNLNVPNLPLSDIKGIRFTSVGFRRYSEEIHAREDARGRPYYWIAGLYEGFDESSDSDCRAVEDGFAAITPHALLSSKTYDWDRLKKAVQDLNAKYFT